MTYDDDNERIERVMFGVPYKATAAEARRVWAEVVETKAWLDYVAIDDLLKSPGAGAVHTGATPEMDRICQLIGATSEQIRAALRAEFDRSSMDYAMLLRHRRRLSRAKRRHARKMARLRRRGW